MKLTRKGLSRGVKLTRQHVFQPMTDVATALANLSLDTQNMETPWAPVRLTISFPVLDSRLFGLAAFNNGVQTIMPFMLPPLQEFFSQQGLTGPLTPQIVLDELGISFDQRGEPAVIPSIESVDPNPGSHDPVPQRAGGLNYQYPDAYDVTVTLLEKTPTYFQGGSQNDYLPEREVVNFHLPADAFAGRTLRLNPFVQSGLGKTINPYKTYILGLYTPNLHPKPGTDFFSNLVSVNLTLRFRHRLVRRDHGVETQNIPASHLGEATAQTVTVNTPTSNSLIRADGTAGINDNLKKFDDLVANGFRAGYGRDSDVPVKESLREDAGYFIMGVPMWNAFGTEYYVRAGTAGQLPYVGTGVFTDPTCDRRIIPIDFPFAIHNVMVVANYVRPKTSLPTTEGYVPTSATFTNKVGVGIGTGLRGDKFDYQQVAYGEWTPASKAAILIDRIKFSQDSLLNHDAYDQELLNLPILSKGTTGAGFYPQGKPFFVGRSNNKTYVRSSCGNGSGGAQVPFTNGQEQWLEVRWSMEDSAGLAPVPVAPTLPVADNDFESPPNIGTGSSGGWTTSNAACTQQAGEVPILTNLGGCSLWWYWTPSFDGQVEWTTNGSVTDVAIAAYVGNTLTTLTAFAQDHGSGIGGSSLISFFATAGTTYKLKVESWDVSAPSTGGPVNLSWVMNSGAAASPFTVYAGMGGHMVWITGKTHLALPVPGPDGDTDF